MIALRNIAIIAALAFVVAVVPGGGNLADGLLAVMLLVFLALFGVAGYVTYRQNRLSFLALTDRQRTILIGAVGAIVLMAAGADEMLDTGPGTLLWIGVIAGSAFAIFRVVADSRSY